MEINHVARIVAQSPDESLLDALGNQHSTETALADLVDNSIEHKATTVLIQLITEDSTLVKLRVVDNGKGMSPDALEEGMQLRRKTYSSSSLSFFGMGMKMASLSQAGSLRVFTQDERARVSGAQMRRKDAGGSFNTEILQDGFAEKEYCAFRREPPGSGTVVEWQRIDDVSISKAKKERDKWLAGLAKRVQRHFSLVFHRFIERDLVRIFVEVWDNTTQEVGSRIPVPALDPFSFRSPIAGYPVTFSGRTLSKARVDLHCALVPPQSESESVRIGGASLDQLSGFYVYRNNRLIQMGGWQELIQVNQKDLQLARIRIELDDNLLHAGMKLTPEKTAVKFSDDVKRAILSSKSAAIEKSFEEYLRAAESLKKTSSQRSTTPQPTLRVVGSENSLLSNSVGDLIGFKNGREQIEIISVPLKPDQVFEMDLENSELRINRLLFEEGGPLDSETGYEFFKATLYFLLESHFTKSALNKNTRLKIEQMHRVLAIALGIQEHEVTETETFAIPTPAVIATFGPPPRPTKIEEPSVEELELQFQPSWSSQTGPNERESIHSLAAQWRSTPVVQEGSENASETTDSALQPRTTLPPKAFSSDPALAQLGLESIKLFRKHRDIALVAQEMRRSENETTALLAQLVLGFEGVLDNADEAFLAGEPFSSSDRERLLSKFRDGRDVHALSLETGRTCMHVAKEILDSPYFSARFDSSLIKELGRVAGR